MIAIVCLDENNGMFFNERRQSKDRYVIRDIVHMVENNTLYINEYSKELFKNTPANIQISEDYFNQVSDNEYCFIENQIVDILNFQDAGRRQIIQQRSGNIRTSWNPLRRRMKN